MNLFQSFQERAQQAVSSARELASTVSSTALDNVKAIAGAVTADAQGVADDVQQKVRALGKPLVATPAQARPRDVGITDKLLCFVRSLTYASFHDREPSTSAEGAADDTPLAAWQVQHATVVLQECKELESLRFVLCPKRMSEQQFWHKYFRLVDHLLEASPTAQSPHTPPGPTSPRAAGGPGVCRSGSGSAEPTERSVTSWEDVGGEAAALHMPGVAYGEDDLDTYLKGMLDGSEAGPRAGVSHGPANADDDADFDQYLEELGDDDDGAEGVSSGAPADADAADLNAYLDGLGLGDDGDVAEVASVSVEAGKKAD